MQQRKFDPADPVALVISQGSAASELLAALFAHPAPSASVSELAAASKVATATAARTVQRLVDAGLVIDERAGRERLLRWNESSLYASAIEDLLWISHGASYEPPTGWSQARSQNKWEGLNVNDLDVTVLIPRCLQAGAMGTRAPDFTEPEVPGPPASQVRALVLGLQRLSVGLRSEPWLQEAYRRWHIEHDRKLIHLTLHQGAGLWQAISALREAARRQAPSAPIPAGVWAHAIYAMNAEAIIATRIAERASAITEAALEHRSTSLRLRDEAYAAVDRERDLVSAHGATSPQPSALDLDAGLLSPSMLRSSDDPGAGFERVLAAQCEAIAEAMAAQVTTMSAHPSFSAWLAANPSNPEDPYPPLLC